MTEPSLRRAALFDLDRTLVRVNTGSLYVRWQRRRGEASRRDLARTLWWVAQYAAGVVDAEAIAERAAVAMRGRDEAAFRDAMRAWVHDEVLPHVADHARRAVDARRAQGYVCAVLTGSTPYSAEPVAAALGIEHVLASRLEVEGGRFTGRCEKPLCYGEGKVRRAEQWSQQLGVDLASSAFYSDSISDMPMLLRVGEPVVINPDPRLRLEARRRRWPVERW